jgi:hypothetical protein
MIAAIPATTYSDLSGLYIFLACLNSVAGKGPVMNNSQANGAPVLSIYCSIRAERGTAGNVRGQCQLEESHHGSLRLWGVVVDGNLKAVTAFS